MSSLGKVIGILDMLGQPNRKKSMDLLKGSGYRALTRQEALARLSQDPEFRKRLKGKTFWLADETLKQKGNYTIDNNGELVQITSEQYDKLKWYQRVIAYQNYYTKDEGPVYVRVFYGPPNSRLERLDLIVGGPEDVMDAVVGIKDQTETHNDNVSAPEKTTWIGRIRRGLGISG